MARVRLSARVSAWLLAFLTQPPWAAQRVQRVQRPVLRRTAKQECRHPDPSRALVPTRRLPFCARRSLTSTTTATTMLERLSLAAPASASAPPPSQSVLLAKDLADSHSPADDMVPVGTSKEEIKKHRIQSEQVSLTPAPSTSCPVASAHSRSAYEPFGAPTAVPASLFQPLQLYARSRFLPDEREQCLRRDTD